MDKTLVSVIVPIYKIPQKILSFCIESILGQSLSDFELILVDDGNDDHCPGMCDDYAQQDQRVKVIHQTNAGVSNARNNGIRMAQSEFIVFVDADDWMDFNTLEVALSHLRRSNADIILWDLAVESEDVFVNSQLEPKEVINYSGAEINFLQRCMIGAVGDVPSGLQGSPCARVFCKSIIVDNNLYFNEDLPRSQDNEFNFRYFEFVKSAILLPMKMYHYRQFKGSATHKYNENAVQIMDAFLSAVREDIKLYSKEEEMKNDFKFIAISKYADICRVQFAHPDNPNKIGNIRQQMKSLYNNNLYKSAFKTYEGKEFQKIMKFAYPLLVREKFVAVLCLFRVRYFLKKMGL